MSDAERIATDLGITYDVVEIDPIVDPLLAVEAGEKGRDSDYRHVGNASARVRMATLYLVADRDHRLVLGTGNRVELTLGYVSKYGDGGVDCNPIGDCYKQQVRQLAASFGVEKALVQKTPTGGMVEYGTDEEEIGLEYDTLDAILALAIDGDVPPAAAARITDTTPEAVDRVRRMCQDNAHRRTAPPTPADVDTDVGAR